MRPVFFETPDDFRAWLAEHHATAAEVLVGFYKKGSGRPSITSPESVDEALCFGWIDGIRRGIDEVSAPRGCAHSGRVPTSGPPCTPTSSGTTTSPWVRSSSGCSAPTTLLGCTSSNSPHHIDSLLFSECSAPKRNTLSLHAALPFLAVT